MHGRRMTVEGVFEILAEISLNIPAKSEAQSADKNTEYLNVINSNVTAETAEPKIT